MEYKVIFSSPSWSLSGVNTAAANLIRELARSGVDARFLVTNPGQRDAMPMPAPGDIPLYFLPVRPGSGLGTRRKALVAFLEDLAPCIYVPGYDFEHSAVCPVLSDKVMVAGVVHSDDPVHYEHVHRLGIYWNAIVCVSQAVAGHVQRMLPDLTPRMAVIPSGVIVPLHKRPTPISGMPLRIVYTGRIIQHQKRVMDLAAIVEGLNERKTPYVLTIVGGGPQLGELEAALAGSITRGRVVMTGTLPNARVLHVLQEQDVFLLTSEFEGTPVSLLEAMAAGCAPVVTDIESGIPELVRDGENGFRIPVGDVKTFVDRLEFLAHDPDLRKAMAAKARETIAGSPWAIRNVARAYRDLFGQMADQVESGAFRRPRGPSLPPPYPGKSLWQRALEKMRGR